MSIFKRLMMAAGADEMEQLYWMSVIDRTVDASSDTGHQITSITADADGYIYTVGQYGQVYKYHPSGGIVWNTRIKVTASNGTVYDLPVREKGTACHVDSSGNVYVTGAMNSDVFVVKLNSSGTVVWYRPLTPSSGGATGTAITTDSSGNVYVAGQTRYISNPFQNQATSLIFKLNSSGVLQWGRYYGVNNQIEEADGIAIDSSGNILVSCYEYNTPGYRQDLVILKYNSSGTLQSQQAYGMDASPSRGDFHTRLALDSSGNRYTLTDSATTSTDRNVYLTKYNSSGTIQWQKRTSGTPVYRGRGIQVDTAGKIYIAWYDTNNNNYIAHFDTSGNLQWQRSLAPSSPYDLLNIYGISLDSYGAVGISGRVRDSSTSHYYGLVTRLPGDGTLTGVYGGISYSSSSSSWVTASGDAGYASHSISASNGSETLSAPSQGAISSQEQSTKYNAVV